MTLLSLAIIYKLHHRSAESAFWETAKIGDNIVRSLEKYHDDRGAYPRNLDVLVPDYLEAIRPPTWGRREWIYTTANENKDWFSLEVRPRRRDKPPMYYSDAGWVYDDDGTLVYDEE